MNRLSIRACCPTSLDGQSECSCNVLMRLDFTTPTAIRTKARARWVLGDLVVSRLNLFIRCLVCHLGAIVSPFELAQRLGYDCRLDGLGRRLKCSKC